MSRMVESEDTCVKRFVASEVEKGFSVSDKARSDKDPRKPASPTPIPWQITAVSLLRWMLEALGFMFISALLSLPFLALIVNAELEDHFDDLKTSGTHEIAAAFMAILVAIFVVVLCGPVFFAASSCVQVALLFPVVKLGYGREVRFVFDGAGIALLYVVAWLVWCQINGG
eukprot:CAMPEP_0181319620 /NCGR_PEP_ID=MMETSP1101-20121128/17675_1 /TAXON_ID=46948 /ORGANISM="Rhodomonas abbreviata, Strain Caron Lab Isolate" /LENGTH=170 /DNA_ID=CAMNT_0023427245 /DNA_START=172 /DNA_END=680 /DNA_ORIENTATION=+